MQKSYFFGNVASDPEKRGQDGTVLAFRIACNRRTRNEQGEWEDTADFFPMVMFGNRAKAVGEFLAKGLPVSIEATPRQNTWTTDDGENRSRIEFVVEDIMVGRKAESATA